MLQTNYSWIYTFSLQSKWRENLDDWTDKKLMISFKVIIVFTNGKFALHKNKPLPTL